MLKCIVKSHARNIGNPSTANIYGIVHVCRFARDIIQNHNITTVHVC